MHALHDVPAPAKLNLFLHITGRRADGYHLLQSAFALIDWCDSLSFEPRAGGAISREDEGGAPLPADDLCVRAARALQDATGCTAGAHIRLHKRIPSQAGMGGGSSDAASTLLALNRLWQLGLSRAVLARIGLSLGADVPFFLHGAHAWAEGVGERLQSIALPPAHFLVLKPSQGINTAQLFQNPLVRRDSPPATIARFVADPYGFGRNDVQAAAEQLCPQVAECLAWLRGQGLKGRMTGSGSATFALVPEAKLPDFTGALPEVPHGWNLRFCSTLERHPLAGWVSETS